MRLLSLVTAAIVTSAMLLPVTSANAETALSVTVEGDVDLNNKFSLSDAVIMMKYLQGRETLSQQAYVNADLNGDGSADIFDMCLFRKKLISESREFSKSISDLQYSTDIHPMEGTSIILSERDLVNYFGPLDVMTIEGDCIDIPTTTDEDIAKFTEIYDEEFFRDNILLLKTVSKPDGGENNIGNIYYTGQTINAEYYRTYSGDKKQSDEEQYQLLQVVIPRELDIANSFEWIYRYPDFEPEVINEYTFLLKSAGMINAIGDLSTPYFNNKSEFDKWVEGKFNRAVERSLKKRYDEDYFVKNDLVIKLYAQNNEQWFVTPIVDINTDLVTLTYSRYFSGCTLHSEVCMTQVIVPKGACLGCKAETKREWEYKSNLEYKEYDLGMLAVDNKTVMTKVDRTERKWVNSQEELDEYLSECLTDEAIELIDAKLRSDSAYVWIDTGIFDTTHTISAAYISDVDKSITVNTAVKTPFGDMGGSFLHILYVPRNKSGYEVKVTSFLVDENYPRYGSAPIEYDFADDSKNDYRTLYVDQYHFDDEYLADLYLTHAGGGGMRFSRVEYLGTIELSKDYKPFINNCEIEKNEDGSCVVTGEAFKIQYSDGILTVSSKTSPDSDYTTKEFDIGK